MVTHPPTQASTASTNVPSGGDNPANVNVGGTEPSPSNQGGLTSEDNNTAGGGGVAENKPLLEVKSIRRGRFSVVTHKPEEIEEVVPLIEMGHPLPDMIGQEAYATQSNAMGGGGGSGSEMYFGQHLNLGHLNHPQYFHQQPHHFHPHHQYMTPLGQGGYLPPGSYSPGPPQGQVR